MRSSSGVLCERDDEMSDLIVALSDQLQSNLIQGQFVSLWAGEVDPATGIVDLVCAGHHPAWIRRNGEKLGLTTTSGGAIGILPSHAIKASLRQQRLVLNPGDVIFHDGKNY